MISKLKTKGSPRSLVGTRERGERLFWIGTEIIVSSFAMRWTEGKRRKEFKKMIIRSKKHFSDILAHITLKFIFFLESLKRRQQRNLPPSR